MENHEHYMRRCLSLAKNGHGRVAPNPMVGCMIVKNDKIMGEGYHRSFGEAHAEVNAIRSVKNSDDLQTSILYVSLEPCSHHGKTPPCADLIIESGIPKVVVAQSDPNPEVAGRGIEKLRAAGIEVITDILNEEAKELNRRFRTFHKRQRPYVILKWAVTADGYMDTLRRKGDQGVFWISSPETKKLVHKWRAQEGAILIGRNTLETDNPGLDTRYHFGKNPLRVVLSGNAELSPNRKIFTDGNKTLVIGAEKNGFGENVEFAPPDGEEWIESTLDALYKRNITSVIVEGGAFTLQRFIERRLWDEARIIHSSNTIGSGLQAPHIPTSHIESIPFGRDRIFYYRNK